MSYILDSEVYGQVYSENITTMYKASKCQIQLKKGYIYSKIYKIAPNELTIIIKKK